MLSEDNKKDKVRQSDFEAYIHEIKPYKQERDYTWQLVNGRTE